LQSTILKISKFISPAITPKINLASCLVVAFFLSWLFIGLAIYKDYGISWDETIERTTGIVNLNYIGEQFRLNWILNSETLAKYRGHQLIEYRDRIFGPFFAIVSVALERVFHIGSGWNEQLIYQFRHLLTFLVSFLGGIAIYQLAKRRFGNWRIGLLAVLFFILSPRFFAESFYNPKDLIFLSFFAIALNFNISLLTKHGYASAIAAAIASAIAIDVRITGIILPVMTVLVLFIQLLKGELNLTKALQILGVYILFIALIIFLFWPWLWPNPVKHFLEALVGFSRWVRSDSQLLFMGQWIRSINLPWQYIPVWIALTTPPLYLILFIIGALLSCYQLIKNGFRLWANQDQLQDLIFVSIVILPIGAVIALNSVLYDGWRHLYFIYPAFLMLALKAAMMIWNITRNYFIPRIIVLVILFCCLSWNTLWIINAHPLQNVYFNIFAGKNWKTKFDVDYWGLGNQLALEYILNHDNRSKITVFAGSDIDLSIAFVILSPAQRERLIRVNTIDTANYVITNYRSNLTDYSKDKNKFNLVYENIISDEVITSVFQRNSDVELLKSSTN